MRNTLLASAVLVANNNNLKIEKEQKEGENSAFKAEKEEENSSMLNGKLETIVIAEESIIKGEKMSNNKEELSKNDDLNGFFEEPEFPEEVKEKKKKITKEKKDNGGIVSKIMAAFMAAPWWIKGSAVLALVFLYMLFTQSQQKQVPKDVNVTNELNTTKPQELKKGPELDKPLSSQLTEKLNACMLASPLMFKYESGLIVPTFSGQDIPDGGTFCDDFTLKDYKLDGKNGTLSVVAKVYSGDTLVKTLSVDPLSYFKPTYYREGIGMKHPKTGAEAVYMPGDTILSSQSMLLKLTSVATKGDDVIYSLTLNGQPTAITVPAKNVQ